MKGKVLLVSPYSQKKVGGIGTWTKSILEYQSKHGKFNLIFLNTAFKFKSNLVKNNYHRVYIGIIDSIYLLFLFIYKTIQSKPQSIHYTSSASFALLKDYLAIRWAKLVGIRFIIHWRFGRIPELYEKRNFEWRLLTRVAMAADISIVLDVKSLKALDNAGIKNVRLIPNPISQELQEIALRVNHKGREFESGKVVYVGHIVPSKGIRELVIACCKLNHILNLILIGPVIQSFKEEIINLVSEHKNVSITWTGEIEREKVFQYLINANALCLPSYTEGFPNVLIEAMAFGCPIIATKVGAIEEIIVSADYGKAGICIDSKDIVQLSEAINFILTNPSDAKDFGRNGVQRVLAKYTLSNIFHQYEELW